MARIHIIELCPFFFFFINKTLKVWLYVLYTHFVCVTEQCHSHNRRDIGMLVTTTIEIHTRTSKSNSSVIKVKAIAQHWLIGLYWYWYILARRHDGMTFNLIIFYNSNLEVTKRKMEWSNNEKRKRAAWKRTFYFWMEKIMNLSCCFSKKARIY